MVAKSLMNTYVSWGQHKGFFFFRQKNSTSYYWHLRNKDNEMDGRINRMNSRKRERSFKTSHRACNFVPS